MDRLISEKAVLDILKNGKKYGERYYSMSQLIEIIKAIPSSEPCEDAISRQAAIDANCYSCSIKANGGKCSKCDAVKAIEKLPSVKPQEQKTGHWIHIDDVMSVFDDFMCGEVDEEGTETFLEMLKDKAESEK